MKVLIVFGTRPEAIKMCPLVIEINKHPGMECVVCVTGQHKEMLRQAMEAFGVVEDYNLDIMRQRQSLASITTNTLIGMEDVLEKENPDIVLVHGDTTTAMAAAMSAFYKKIPVGHVEAGLRTGNMYSPYPEEMNRIIIDRLSTYLFAPTEANCKNLKKENICENVYVTGNTVIDSFKYTVKEDYTFCEAKLNQIDFNKKVIVVTAHRRENWGDPLENICFAINQIAHMNRDVVVVYPVHLNPIVRSVVYRYLDKIDNVILTEPLNVVDMHNLISKSYLILTDSGGLQEEAPAFGKPVLVLRNDTERPEAVEAGTAKIIGTNSYSIVKEVTNMIHESALYKNMSLSINPYGDGNASKNIVKIIGQDIWQ